MTQQNLPRQFGKYVLTRKLAMGGMAEIFKAKTAGAEGFEKEIVIKRILPHFTDDESFVKMFIDEASITSKLQHANIVQIYDFDMCERSYYIAMEYVEGVDLKQVIDVGVKQGKPLSVAQCAWIMMELSKGLHYAHIKEHKGKPLNIVHRDISPHNAMVSYSGEVKLMDFGIAKAAQRSTKTMAGTVKGKVAYMSPEQARGKPLDGRSDLFALGIMMWEMLTHKRLFLGDSDFETLTNVLKSDPPPPSSINKTVPPEIDAIVLKALEKDRDARYPNVEAFNRELTRWYYSNVTDLEKEALKPFMHDLFAADIERNRQLTAAERAASGEAPDEPEESERTLAMPAGEFPPPPNAAADLQSAATLLDDGTINQEQIRKAMAAQKAAGAAGGADTTASPVGTGTYTQQGFTGTYSGQMLPPERSGKGWLIAIAAILFLGGGGFAAWYFLTQDKTPDPPVDTTPVAEVETADLVFTVDPASATVLINGSDKTADLKAEFKKGDEVNVRAEAPGYETFTQTFVIEGDRELDIKLEKERPEVTTVVQVDGDPKAGIYIDGEKVGEGTVPLKGRDGDSVEVEIRPSAEGAEPIKKTVDLKTGMEVIKVTIEAATKGAKLMFKVTPDDAEVTASKGEVKRGDAGTVIVEGLEVGDKIEVEVSKAGFETSKKSYELTGAELAGDAVALAKKSTGGGGGGSAPAASGDGEVVINANPWANIAIDGRPLGTTPKKVTLSAGRHTVVLTKGGKTETKVITVKANDTVRVTADMN